MTDAVTLRVGRLGQVPAGLQHWYMVVDDARKLIVMCRQLRLDLAECALPVLNPAAAGTCTRYCLDRHFVLLSIAT